MPSLYILSPTTERCNRIWKVSGSLYDNCFIVHIIVFYFDSTRSAKYMFSEQTQCIINSALTQATFTRFKSTIETPKQFEICSKLIIKASEDAILASFFF